MKKAVQKKSKVCIDCKKRKQLKYFPIQSNQAHKTYSSDGYRTECKKCHQKKTRTAYFNRTTPEERKKYMREYMRQYNHSPLAILSHI